MLKASHAIGTFAWDFHQLLGINTLSMSVIQVDIDMILMLRLVSCQQKVSHLI